MYSRNVLGQRFGTSAGSINPSTCDTPCDKVLPGTAAGLDRWARHEHIASKKVGNNSLQGCHTIACSFSTDKAKNASVT